MNLALTILFLWLGLALLFIAFHPLSLETSKGSPSDVLRALQNSIGGVNPGSTSAGGVGEEGSAGPANPTQRR